MFLLTSGRSLYNKREKESPEVCGYHAVKKENRNKCPGLDLNNMFKLIFFYHFYIPEKCIRT